MIDLSIYFTNSIYLLLLKVEVWPRVLKTQLHLFFKLRFLQNKGFLHQSRSLFSVQIKKIMYFSIAFWCYKQIIPNFSNLFVKLFDNDI